MKQDTITIDSVQLPRITIGAGRPRILMTAGIHGDEFSQQLVLKQFISAPSVLAHGQIIILPRCNPLALANNTEINPVDNKNLNRIFPGGNDSTSARIAAVIMGLVRRSDLVIDLHNFTDPAISQTIFVDTGDSNIRRQTAQLCNAYRLPLIWRISLTNNTKKMISGTLLYNAITAGVPAVGAELPPLDVLTQTELKAGITGLHRVVQHCINPNQTMPQRPSSQLIERFDIRAPEGGLFIPVVKLGETTRAEQCIGKIISKEYSEKKVLAKPGMLIRIRRPGPVSAETLLGSIGHPVR